MNPAAATRPSLQTRARTSFGAALIAAFVAGCGGGADNGSTATATNGSSTPGSTPTMSTGFGACVAGFSSQRSTVDNHCTNCSSAGSNNANAVDGNRDTYAVDTIQPSVSGTGAANSPTTGTVMFTATAQSGITFPAGEQAGAIVRFPGGTAATGTVTFSTFLSGTPQETFAADSGDTSGTMDQILLHKTTKAFDAVQALFSINAPDGTDKRVQLYEFCS